jgi:glycosyltransferase involved in cell wall biosynthesis
LIRRESNGGLAAARNTGIAAARGEYVGFLDDDDLFTPDRLEIAEEGLARAPIALCWIRYLDEADDATGWRRRLDGDVRDELFEDMTPHVGQAVLRRDVLEEFDPSFVASQDIEWWVRTVQRASVSTVPRVGYLFRRHAGVRHGNGLPARVVHRQRMLGAHADFFAERPRSAAFQWKRIGLTALAAGEAGAARRAFGRSLRLQPDARTGWHLVRSTLSRSTPARRRRPSGRPPGRG